MDARNMVGLDFETYGAVSLPDHGLHRYASHSSFTPLIVSIATQDQDTKSVWAETLDFTAGYEDAAAELERQINGKIIVAHNAGFEQRVLAAMGIVLPSSRFVDSAVVARAVGAGGSLGAAAPQLLNADKMEEGRNLIRLFSIPGKLQEENDSLGFDNRIVTLYPSEWQQFKIYCELDAILSLRIALQYGGDLTEHELEYQAITMDMNNTGWPVDVPIVEEMQRRYLDNQDAALQQFRDRLNAHDLNLNSLKQLKEWCAVRGIKATSFDEAHVESLMKKISKRLDDYDRGAISLSVSKYNNYCEVLQLLETKQILGGSSLKKLQVILDTVSKDCRLRDQYLHVGAGQTWRTTGRSVQMQNLKRLGAEPADMSELQDLDVEWDNAMLAANLRQTFTSSHPNGRLVVGDFSSVEARGLCWLAGDADKLRAYRSGQDMYKVLAQQMYHVNDYDQVTKEQRQAGKVGVLSCGYQAGGGAVQAFAAKMGIEFTEAEATKLVSDWRAANPLVVQLWDNLDTALHGVVEDKASLAGVRVGPTMDFLVRIYTTATPISLLSQHPGAQSIVLELIGPDRKVVLHRYFHGCYLRGNSVCYYKPSERKTGDLWSSHFVDPKTKQVRFYSIYGGKLTGILTQSFCREIFFRALKNVHAWCQALENVELIGQFHDEIVLDWTPPTKPTLRMQPDDDLWRPGQVSLDSVMIGMNRLMSDAGDFSGFPLEADIKHDYRYTK